MGEPTPTPIFWERDRRSMAKKKDAASKLQCGFQGIKVKKFLENKKNATRVSLWSSRVPSSGGTASAQEIEELTGYSNDIWLLSRVKRYEDRKGIGRVAVLDEDISDSKTTTKLPPINSRKYDKMFPKNTDTPCKSMLVSHPKSWKSKVDPPFPWAERGPKDAGGAPSPIDKKTS